MAALTIDAPDACVDAIVAAEAEGALTVDEVALADAMYQSILLKAEEVKHLARGKAEGELTGDEETTAATRMGEIAAEIEQVAKALANMEAS